MNGERVTLDSNILFYTIDAASGTLQEKARRVVEQAALGDSFLTLQALCEFVSSTTRKGKLTISEAAAYVEDWQTVFPVAAATPGSLRMAVRAVEQHNLSFWDAMQWAVAKQAGATLLLSEDLQHDRELEGVQFRNPFLMDVEDLLLEAQNDETDEDSSP